MGINISLLQINRMSSWIDGSFVYSTRESWVSAMRSFKNGTLNMDPGTASDSLVFGLPPKNKARAPLENNPAPHVLRMLDPERMFRKYYLMSNWISNSQRAEVAY